METVSIFMMLGQGLYLILLIFEKSEKCAAYGMAWKNGRVSLRYILLFVVITIIANAVYLFLIGTPLEKICTESVLYFVKLPYAVFSYLATIGSIFWEEYGWRYYFQPVLQRKLGPVFGVLILGIMWELWHLPSILFNMNMSGMSLILLAVMRLFNTTSLAFCFGYIYLKTQNLWTAVIVHFLFDVICSIGGSLPADNTEISITWNEVSMVALSRLIIILPFVFLISREYKAQEKQQDEV